MGFFYDMVQSIEIEKVNKASKEQEIKTHSLELRVKNLELQLQQTREVLHKTLCYLEKTYHNDIDGNGVIGKTEK